MAAALYTPSSKRQLAQHWCRQDPNPTTAAYVQYLLNKANNDSDNDSDTDEAELLQRLFPSNPQQRIAFGTSGLRGPFQPGPLGMNDLVVVQTAQGLARYLEQQHAQSESTALRVVIGYDHRALPPSSPYALSSRHFAVLTALVFLHAGWQKENVVVLDGYVPTPLVPFASQEWEAPLGIMITASHNPAQDAGYKIYYQACQILSPRDVEIQGCIEQNLEPWTDYLRLVQELQQEPSNHVGSHCWGLSNPQQTKQLVECYFGALAKSGLFTGQYAKYLERQKDAPHPSPLPLLVYTAMHGVGFQLAQRICHDLQLPSLYSVPQQEQPDPMFPTVPFPNPEERHALDLAKEFGLQQLQLLQQQQDEARHRNIVILANDPDADRLAVAEYNGQTQKWTTLTGDQIGILLGHCLWTQIGKSSKKPVAMCQSLVSSRMLAEIGRVEGFRVDETLTGFKWIGTQAKKLHQEGYNVLLAYEESIGYCCGNVVFDKDGISALGVFAELIVHVYGCGHPAAQQEDEERSPTPSLIRHLQALYDKYGEFVSHNGYYFFRDPKVVEVVLNKMRNHGAYDLKMVGGYEIASIRDLGVPGYDSTTLDHRPLLATSKSSPMVTLCFTNGCVAQFRASGTEPKFKYYIEMKGEPGVARHVIEERLAVMAETILEILLEPSKHGLVAPNKN